MVPYDTQNYEMAGNSMVTIVIDNDGRAELLYGDDVVAVREEGEPWNPAGDYVATEFGEETYNPTPVPEAPPEPEDPDPDPDPTPDPDPIPESDPTTETDPEVILPGTEAPAPDPDPDPDPDPEPDPGPPGQPWTAVVRLIPVNPKAGFVYAKIVETSGEMVATEGPFFGALPDNTGTEFYVPIAVSDGLGGMEQKVTGAIQWGATTAAGGGGGGAAARGQPRGRPRRAPTGDV
jgi:outer membrane biosynthesis protein TonB